jgi:hypothetical protein
MPDHVGDRGAVRLDPGASRSPTYQADEHVQTTGPEHGDRHPPRPVKGVAEKQHAGLLELDAAIRSQHPSSRGRSTEGLCPGAGAASSHPDTYAASAPNQEPGRILIPGDGAAGDQGAQNRPACVAIAATRRVRPVPSQRFLALWCQAHTPSCSRQVTRPRSAWSNQARLALLAVTHR